MDDKKKIYTVRLEHRGVETHVVRAASAEEAKAAADKLGADPWGRYDATVLSEEEDDGRECENDRRRGKLFTA